MKPKAAIRTTRGYARGAADEKRLQAAGVKAIYRQDNGETLGKFKLRSGETLSVVDGLLAFGDARRDMAAAIKLVHSWGAVVVDAETGLRSDRDGVEMLHQALSPAGPSPEFAAAMQAKSVRARVKGRMPKKEAERIWFDRRYTTAEALELMHLWKQATAYNAFGPRGVSAGRPPKQKR